MQLSEQIVYVIMELAIWLLIWVTVEQLRLIAKIVVWGQSRRGGKKKGKKKGGKKTTKGSKSKKPPRKELEELVRQMFPEPPKPNERSRARAAMVAVVKGSARGLFDLLPEEKCVSLLKKIGGAGKGCPRCGSANIKEGKKAHYREYYQRCSCQDCKEQGRTATFYEMTGTIFEGTHLTAKQWLWGMYLFVGGCSAREMAGELDVNLKSAQRMMSLLQ